MADASRLHAIDVHSHFLPPEVQRHAGEEWLPELRWSGDRQVLDYEGRSMRAIVHEFGRIDGVLEANAAIGVDGLLLSPWANLLAENFEGDQGRRVAGMLNEGMARAAEAAVGRVFALGTVPLLEAELAARELESLMADFRFHGVEVSTTIGGRFLGDDRFRPFWAAAERTGAIVFVHPSQQGLGLSALGRFRLWNLVGNPTETAFTVADMVMSGLLEQHPALKVVLAHAGGSILSVRGRMLHGWTVAPESRSALTASPDESLRRLYYDTVTHDPAMLRRLLDFAGAGHVLLGSDYPFDMATADPVRFVREADLTPADEEAVLNGNALALLGLAPTHTGG